jgi:hypothetical protein
MEEMGRFPFSSDAPVSAEQTSDAPAFTEPPPAFSAVAAAKASGSKKFPLLGLGVLLVLIVGGYLYLATEPKKGDMASENPENTAEQTVGNSSSEQRNTSPSGQAPASGGAASSGPSNPAALGSAPSKVAPGLTSSNPSVTGVMPSNPIPNPASPNTSVVASPSSGPSAETSAQGPNVASPGSKPSPSNPDYVTDHSQEAVDLVKNYALDGGRGTVAAWLQYSYPPGSNEKWTANPEDSAGIYMVQYQVSRDGQKSGESGSRVYVFQVDIDQKSVNGFNRAAKELLAGGASSKSAHKPTHKVHQRVPKHKKHRALKPGQIPLLPLPSDADLRRRAKSH